MDNISGDCDHIERQRGDFLKIIGTEDNYGIGRETRIWIGSENCRVCEGKNFGCEITQVLLGPLNLYLDKNEPIFGV